jgi:hypothetical protein
MLERYVAPNIVEATCAITVKIRYAILKMFSGILCNIIAAAKGIRVGV